VSVPIVFSPLPFMTLTIEFISSCRACLLNWFHREDPNAADHADEMIISDDESEGVDDGAGEASETESDVTAEEDDDDESIIEIPRRRPGEGFTRGRQGGTLTHTASGRKKTLNELAEEESTDEDDEDAPVVQRRRLNGNGNGNVIVRGRIGSMSFEGRMGEAQADRAWAAAEGFVGRVIQAAPRSSRGRSYLVLFFFKENT
jgi:hypothetical protein